MQEKTRVTARISKETWESFVRLCEQVGLRRDTFINLALPKFITHLEQVRTGHFVSRLNEYHFRDRSTTVEVKLSLDKELVSRITTLCREKRYPRNLFFDVVIAQLHDIIDINIFCSLDIPPDATDKRVDYSNVFEDNPTDADLSHVQPEGPKR